MAQNFRPCGPVFSTIFTKNFNIKTFQDRYSGGSILGLHYQLYVG